MSQYEEQSVEVAIIPITAQQHSYDQADIDQAIKFTTWSWFDVMTAFREIGYDPTEAEEQRIKRALFTKKINHLTKDKR